LDVDDGRWSGRPSGLEGRGRFVDELALGWAASHAGSSGVRAGSPPLFCFSKMSRGLRGMRLIKRKNIKGNEIIKTLSDKVD